MTSKRVPKRHRAHRRRAVARVPSPSVRQCRVHSPRSRGVSRGTERCVRRGEPHTRSRGSPGGGAGCGARQSGAWPFGTCLLKHLYSLPKEHGTRREATAPAPGELPLPSSLGSLTPCPSEPPRRTRLPSQTQISRKCAPCLCHLLFPRRHGRCREGKRWRCGCEGTPLGVTSVSPPLQLEARSCRHRKPNSAAASQVAHV